jgi:hypothetical protein
MGKCRELAACAVGAGTGLDWTGSRWDGDGYEVERERHGMFPFSRRPMGMGIGYSKVTLERDSLAGGQPPDATVSSEELV